MVDRRDEEYPPEEVAKAFGLDIEDVREARRNGKSILGLLQQSAKNGELKAVMEAWAKRGERERFYSIRGYDIDTDAEDPDLVT